LVNGSPTLEFKITRGLRQGDPLAPFLFIVAAEGLSGLVRQALTANLLIGIKVGRKEVEVGVLQFADDTLFFCEETFSNVFTIKAILRCYELASGLKINFHKSKLAGVNVSRETLEVYAKTLHCNLMRVTFKYLGLEVGGNPTKKLFWEPIIDRLSAKLNVWKGRFLSLAGRICLIKSVFTSLPLFYLSFFKAPEAVCDRIISIQRRFLWGWGREKRTIPWVSWENLCKPKDEGGLGIKNVRYFNRALLAKWKWRLMGEEKGMWKQILTSKYGTDIDQNCNNKKNLSWWWKDLGKCYGEGEEVSWFHGEIGWKVGRGDKVRFWEDAWLGESPLSVKYHRLYSVSLDKGRKVSEVGVWEEDIWIWNLRWRRTRFQWELEQEKEMITAVERVHLNMENQDSLTWGDDSSSIFTVKAAYECLSKCTRGSPSRVFK